MKKTIIGGIVLSASILLAGCSELPKFFNNSDDEGLASETLIDARGVFEGQFESNYIDVNVDGVKKMYKYVSDVSGIVEDLDKEKEISFSYEETDKGERIIHSISTVDGRTVKAEDYKTDLVSKEEEQKEKENFVKESTSEGTNGAIFDLELKDGYMLVSDTLYYKKNMDFKAKIEKLAYSTNLKTERDKVIASLDTKDSYYEQLKNNNIPETDFSKAEFIYVGYFEDKNRYVAVKWRHSELYKFTVDIPLDDGYKTRTRDLFNILNTIRVK